MLALSESILETAAFVAAAVHVLRNRWTGILSARLQNKLLSLRTLFIKYTVLRHGQPHRGSSAAARQVKPLSSDIMLSTF